MARGRVARSPNQPPRQRKRLLRTTPTVRPRSTYDLTMGHLYEQEYGESSKGADADRAIDFYKKAYALDPSSAVIGEQLAEMYFMSQRTPEAINEVQNVLRARSVKPGVPPSAGADLRANAGRLVGRRRATQRREPGHRPIP